MTPRASRAWSAATVLAVVIGTAGAFATLPTPDVTWLLHVAGVLLDGGRLGVEAVENSPPVILWLEMPAVLVARATGWDSWLVWIGAVALLAAASVWCCGRLFRRIPSLSGSAAPMQAVVAVGLFLLPRQEFGQREHVTVCLALPWLLVVAARAEDAAISRAAVWVAALGGGLGLSIKPHFALVWLAAAGVLAWRARSIRTLRRPEVVASAMAPGLAVAATLLLHPEWLPYARLYGPHYQHFKAENPAWVALVGEGVEWSWLGILTLIVYSRLVRPMPGALRVLAAALLAFHLTGAVQMKGWVYHFLPAGALGLLVAFAAGSISHWPDTRLVHRVYRFAVPLGVIAAAALGLRRGAMLLVDPGARWSEAEVDLSLQPLLSEVVKSGHQERLLVVSTNIGSGWPLAHLAGAEWTLRHPSVWILGAIYAEETSRPGLIRLRAPVNWSAEERRMVAELRTDLSRRPPTVVIVPDPAPSAPVWAESQRFDYLPYVLAAAGPRLTRCLELPRQIVGGYLVWNCR